MATQLWDPNQLDQLRKLYAMRMAQQQQAQAQAQQQAAPKKTSGRGGFLTSLIGEAGGLGGAAAGAAAGTAVLPGIGTVIGGVLGGALGGFGGSAVEQQVRNSDVNWGQAGVDAAFSAIPGGTGKVVKTVGKATAEQGFKAGAKDELANFFGRQPGKVSTFVNNAGQDAQAGVRGVVANAPVQGRASQRLTDTEAQQINDFLNQQGLKGARGNQQQLLEKIQHSAGQDINDIVHGAPKPVGTETLATAQDNIRARLLGQNGQGVVGFNPAQHADIANQFAGQMAGIKDSAGWLNFKRGLDDIINYSRGNQSVDPMVERVAKVFRGEASRQLTGAHPEVAPANAIYSQAQKALNVMARGKDPNGIKVGSGLIDFGGTGVGSNAIQAGKDAAARTAQKVKGLSPAADQFMRQVVSSGANNVLIGKNQQPTDAMGALPGSPDQLFGDGNNSMGGGLDSMMGMDAGQSADTGLAYSSTDLTNAAIMAAKAGDYKSSDQLAQLAQLAAGQEKAAQAAGGAGGLNVTKVTSQQYGLANSGMQALQQLSGMIQSDPGIVSKTATPGRNLPIVGGVISNAAGTGQYDAIGYNIADAILRLRTGATANASEVKNLQSQIMPRAGDSQQTIQTKLQQIANIFGPTLALAQQGGGASGGGGSFEEQLMSMMGGQQPAYGY